MQFRRNLASNSVRCSAKTNNSSLLKTSRPQPRLIIALRCREMSVELGNVSRLASNQSSSAVLAKKVKLLLKPKNLTTLGTNKIVYAANMMQN